MKQASTFYEPVIASTASKMAPEIFDRSVEQFDQKSYRDALHSLLDYIDPSLRSRFGNPEGTRFSIPHGSVIVNIETKGDRLEITAPFVRLPEKGRIPLLRQVAGLNTNVMDLACIFLEDGKLFFRYDCPMALTHPSKIYDILWDICTTGDRYDDEFVAKFGAERIYEPQITPYDAATVDRIYNELQALCTECLEGVKFFEADRMYGYCWNLLSTALFQINYFARPQGELLNTLDKAIRDMDRNDIPQPEIVTRGKQAVEQLRTMTREQLAESLYNVETFVSDKRRSNLGNIQSNFEDCHENATEYIESENFRACTVVILNKFYAMYYYNNVQDDVNAVVARALRAASALPWEEAAQILYDAMDNIMEGELDIEDETPAMPEGIDMEAIQAMQQAAMAQAQQAMAGVNMEEYMKGMQQMMSAMFGGKKEE